MPNFKPLTLVDIQISLPFEKKAWLFFTPVRVEFQKNLGTRVSLFFIRNSYGKFQASNFNGHRDTIIR